MAVRSGAVEGVGILRFTATPIAGVWEIETHPYGDARGRLTRLYCAEAFEDIRPGLRFVQVNQTYTGQRGTVRGMHYQRPPALEAKLVRCLHGRVHDVIVDLRAGSATFGRWHSVQLSGDMQREVFIPEGCAHGFQALSNDVQMLYLHSAPYTPSCESGVRHDDPRLAITWPLPVTLISERDIHHALIDEKFSGVMI